jgi:hypothetical protein
VSYFTPARNNAVLCIRTQAEFVGRFRAARFFAPGRTRESVRPPPQINALATGALAVRGFEDFEVSAGS